MLTTFTQVKRKMNRKLEFIGMVPSKVDGRNPRHVRHLQELQEAYPNLMVPVTVGLRNSIADALASHVPVWKIKRPLLVKLVKKCAHWLTMCITKWILHNHVALIWRIENG
nr:IncC partitioning protein [uncultured bacterium]